MSEVLAGKIGVTNGGEWNAETYYEEATFVRHQNNLYLSNLPSTGVEPTNEEYWMLAMEGFSGEDVQTLIDSINNIIDGTTQVGNAKNLDGHEAEYFAKGTDLANYLPLTGGKISKAHPTPLQIENTVGANTQAFLEFLVNGISYGHLGFDGANNPIFRNTDGNYLKFIHTGNMANHVLPLVNGGKPVVKTYSNDVIIFDNINDNPSVTWIDFRAKGEDIGAFGFTQGGVPLVFVNGGVKQILHTGNKPTGTYTGNGSATQRTIKFGGVGNVAVIYSGNTMALVGFGGYIRMASTEGVGTTVTGGGNAYIDNNGDFQCANADPALNASGVQYTYRVL